MKVYIAGPMQGIPLYNFPAFDAAAAALRELGHEVVSPAEVDRAHGFDPNREISRADYRDFLRNAIRAMLDCEGIVLLPGWELSHGARLERTIAMSLEMTIVENVGGMPGAMPRMP